jgi:hypothetical protein
LRKASLIDDRFRGYIMIYEKCTLHGVEFKNCSTMGNPCYYVSFTDSTGDFHRGYTASNSSAGYTAANYRYAENGGPIWLDYHFTKKGTCIINRIKHNTPDAARKEK